MLLPPPDNALPSSGSTTDDKLLVPYTNRSFSPRAQRDFVLIRRIIDCQEEKAYTELLGYYRLPVYHLIRRMVRQADEAEDLTMEVLARACHYLPSFQPTFSFSTWLFRIATNYCIDHLRRRRLLTVSLHATPGAADEKTGFLDLPDAAPTPQEALIRVQRSQHLREVVARLPTRYQRVVQLHYFEELSCEEIAGRQGLPVGTVKSQLYHCRRLLAQQLASTVADI